MTIVFENYSPNIPKKGIVTSTFDFVFVFFGQINCVLTNSRFLIPNMTIFFSRLI